MEEIKTEDVMQIIKILRENEERDLITKIRIHFEELLDEDYVPPKKIFKKEEYSDSEGSAVSEEVYCWETDEHGLLSLV